MSILCRGDGSLHSHETVAEVKNCYGQAGQHQRYRRPYPQEAARNRRSDASKAAEMREVARIFGTNSEEFRATVIRLTGEDDDEGTASESA